MKTYLMSCICAVLLAVSCNQSIGAATEPTAAVVDQAAPTELAVEKIDLNTADVAELSGLPGIGPKIAERIDAYRQANGPFKSIDDLMEVKGIGPAKFEKLRSLITVS